MKKIFFYKIIKWKIQQKITWKENRNQQNQKRFTKKQAGNQVKKIKRRGNHVMVQDVEKQLEILAKARAKSLEVKSKKDGYGSGESKAAEAATRLLLNHQNCYQPNHQHQNQ